MGVKEPKSKEQALNRLGWRPPPAFQANTLRMLRISLKGVANKNMEELAQNISHLYKDNLKCTLFQ